MPFSQYITKLENHEIDEISQCIRMEKFLNSCGINSYKLRAIERDASKRRYYRVITYNHTYILMDSKEELSSFTPFVNIANLLIKNGLKAPNIHYLNKEEGLLLLEDLGNESFTKFLESNSQHELDLYLSATDVLIKISHIRSDDITLMVQDDNLLKEGLSTFTEFYISRILNPKKSLTASKDILNAFHENFKVLKQLQLILTLRDYHADNLMWLNGNSGISKVGILDFQDALLGVPCYDLVSLLEDARRDVKEQVVVVCKEKYFNALNNMGRAELEFAYATLGAQRNLRIIGLFHRLHLQYQREKYLKYLPRVWGYVKRNLNNHQLSSIKEIFNYYNLYEF